MKDIPEEQARRTGSDTLGHIRNIGRERDAEKDRHREIGTQETRATERTVSSLDVIVIRK